MPYYDVIVVGAGPGGATAAYELANAGISVLIIDKEKFPRYKPCGGGLSLKIDKILNIDIKETIENTIKGAYFSYKQKEGVFLLSDKPVAYMVMRDRFDSLLLSEAVKSGASFIDESHVKGISNGKNGYEIFVNKNPSPLPSPLRGEGWVKGGFSGDKVYNCKYIIGADGANGIVRRFLYPGIKRTLAASIEAEIPVDEELTDNHSHYVHIDFGVIPYGYAWVFPKKGFLSAGIAGFKGVAKHPKRYFEQFINGHNKINGTTEYKYKGHPIPIFNKPLNLTKGGVMLVGDAGNLVDPFFGEGIYYAIRSSQIASTVVSEAIMKGKSDLSGYDTKLSTEFYPEFMAAQQISQFVYTFPRIWFNVLSDKPELAEQYYNVLRGENRYSIFLKEIKSIAGSLMKTALKKGFLQLFK